MALDTSAPSPETPLEYGPHIGRYLDHNIHAWLQMADGRYDFDGIAAGPRPGYVDMAQLASDEICVTPGLRYKRMQGA